MRIYDIVHGYQPFTPDLVSDWVQPNLERIFLPTSRAMAEGLVRRSVQLQGWTIDAWLGMHGRIRSLAEEVLTNLRTAAKKGHIEVGFSSYSHALLPLLGERLTYAQMLADYDTVKEHIAEPAFFWYPECAMDAARIRILGERFPDKIAVVPNGALGIAHSTFTNITGLGGEKTAKPGSPSPSHYGRETPLGSPLGEGSIRVAVANTLVKDVLMNATVYKKPEYVPQNMDWERSRQSMRNGTDLKYVLEHIDGRKDHIIVRDWENGESRDSLQQTDDAAEVAAMLDSPAEYKLLSEAEYSGSVSLKDVRPSCWEPYSTPDNPFPYWAPTNISGWKTKAKDHWLELLSIYERGFDAAVTAETGGCSLDAVQDAFKSRKFHALFKKTSPALLSCLPWHLFAREEWERFPEFPKQLLEKVILPYTTEMLEYAGQDKQIDNLHATVHGFIRTINSQ